MEVSKFKNDSGFLRLLFSNFVKKSHSGYQIIPNCTLAVGIILSKAANGDDTNVYRLSDVRGTTMASLQFLWPGL